MNINDVSTLVQLIFWEAHILKKRVYLYWDGKDVYLKDKVICNHHKLLASFNQDHDVDSIRRRVTYEISRLIEGGHIPSSLGKWSEIMRQGMENG